MYNQKYENRNIVQAEINRNGRLITSFDFADCKSAEKIEINRRDTTIFRGEFEEIVFKNDPKKEKEEQNQIQLIRLYGAHIKKLKTPLLSNTIGVEFHDDAPDGRAFVHSDSLLDDVEIEGNASFQNTEIEHLTVQQYAKVTIDGPLYGKIDTARVFGTLHLSGTIPFRHIELYPGGRIRVWNIEKDDDIPRFVGMRGNVLIQKARGGGFWYFG